MGIEIGSELEESRWVAPGPSAAIQLASGIIAVCTYAGESLALCHDNLALLCHENL